MHSPITVGILLFTDVEVLDFSGPFEVFSVATRVARRDNDAPGATFDVFTVGRTGKPIQARNRLTITPRFSIADCPKLDILVVPGGVVTEPLHQPDVIEWIRARHRESKLTASVCTGAFLLGEAGLLDGLLSTTHWEDTDDLRRAYPATTVLEDVPFVDEGRIVMSAGIASGIGMCLNIVADLFGEDLARRTARQMVYTFEAIPRAARLGTRAGDAGDWRSSILHSTSKRRNLTATTQPPAEKATP